MTSRGSAAAAIIGGAALAAGLTAWRVLSTERSATIVPLQRLARKYRSKSRAGLVPVAKGAECWGCCQLLVGAWPQCTAEAHTLPLAPCSNTWLCALPPNQHVVLRLPDAGAPQGDLSVLPSQYPAVRRDDSVVEVLHGETIAGALQPGDGASSRLLGGSMPLPTSVASPL